MILMLKQNIGVKILAIFITTIILFTGATMFLSGNVKAWDANVAVGPSTVTSGDTVDFEVRITNTGSKSMEITYVGIHFDWMPQGYYHGSGDVSDSNPYVLGSGDSTIFYINGVPIPEGITTHTYHAAEVLIKAADPGIISEWGSPYSQTYSGSVFVEEPTYTVSGYVTDANTGDSIDGATVSMGSYSTTTDYDGYYSISGIKEGTYTITVDADGYQSSSKTITVNDNMEVDFQLTPTSGGGGGGNNGGSTGISSGSGGLGWLIPLAIFIVILIAIIAVIAMVMSSKKKNAPPPYQALPPPPMETQKQGIQPTTKICPYCGREIPADAKICPYCGNKVG